MTTENNLSENEEQKPSTELQETVETIENTEENHQEEDPDAPHHDSIADLSLADTLKEMEKIINSNNAGERYREFNALKEKANHTIHDEIEDKKHEYTDAGNAIENFSYEHPSQSKLSGLIHIFREKHDNFQKNQEEEQKKNLDQRQSIIERLKNLYTNSEPGVNLFKSIREIKEEWSNSGQVAKSEFKILNNNYFHHLNQFYQMLDLNKEFLEQEYSHNLEKRQHIIARAKELENEPVVQKALNELQYLHKLWKEEAEPVSEEFREKTWEEFKEISNKIHERKTELSAAIETEQNANLEKKNEIITEIKNLSEPKDNPNHTYWQNSIKKVEELRSEFLKTGSVPRKLSNNNWNDFKSILRAFNTTKNNYYKSLKGSQQQNLDEKMKLIQTAKDNMLSEDWDLAVALFKKLQEDWKKIGHVPKSMTNKIWDEFRDACNTFFNNYREKSSASTDNWKENYKLKKDLLEELKTISDEEGSIEKIEAIKSSWNNIGKVPRDKMAINSEFNKTLREKLKLNKINELELKEEGLSENQLTDKARKIKSQISDLEAEIVKLENNLAFFKNPSRENPLLRDTYNTIDDKKAHLETLKQNLHSIIAGE
ncbi:MULTISPECIES: DUF349 domain-containing protein [Chryseobacterium]|jgi:hypothetical protein|uniref:Domain of Uncharacterized Function (DUF349) n=1 Tax=Chryseobacterium balustinum TaxID=246 RepID=A0AAX2IPK6_9FLAO|nr:MULTISPECIES: DUF349 domain-containing protein [Chryseobacterium]AZB30818.1 DUF349 domain-containing protein [Chryseobacterium balustinum]MDY0931751.1 DUF349 domain-containing protein [Chryseobacterium sp. CFBP8996]SKB99700.1 protein of unknown function [Chryseobacterium balustinum]SQA91961.1 Domain of Uncharacterised Function (DUF349) [Chryseobacterium balustinum]